MTSNTEGGILVPSLEKYLEKIARPRDSILDHLERDAEKNAVPIIGPQCGNLLSLIVTTLNAKRVLEIGTATGYSGIWLARPLVRNSGKLLTIEYDPKRAKLARQNFKKAGLENTEVIEGNAKEIVPELARKEKGNFDLVLLDVGEKTIYVDLLEYCIALLREGGFLVADNVLWGGFVAVNSDRSKETEIMRKFNKTVYSDKRLHPVVIPLRDGVMIARKSA